MLTSDFNFKGEVICFVVMHCCCRFSLSCLLQFYSLDWKHKQSPFFLCGSFPLSWPLYTSYWKPLPALVKWLTSCPQLQSLLTYVVILTTPTRLLSSLTSHRWHVPVDKTLELASANSAGTVWPCHATPRGDYFKCIKWVMFTAAQLGHFWWVLWQQGVKLHIVVREDMCTAADSELLFFF